MRETEQTEDNEKEGSEARSIVPISQEEMETPQFFSFLVYLSKIAGWIPLSIAL